MSSDVSGWSALWSIAERDAAGNALIGLSVAVGATNSYVRSTAHLTVAVGVEDVVLVTTQDAVLVTTRERADEVKAAVVELMARAEPKATEASLAYRPWGSYQVVDRGPGFQVKRITVKPGHKLSLQSHARRAEHRVVVQCVATVTIDREVKTVRENEPVFIPLGAMHFLHNEGLSPLQLIEVESGSYFGEDDIRRFEDDYRRD